MQGMHTFGAYPAEKKSASHPQCAFADSMSTVMCGAIVSLTPCIAPTCDRECDPQEYAEYERSMT